MLYAERRNRLSAQGRRARPAELPGVPDRAPDVGAECHEREDIADDSHRQATRRHPRRILISRPEKGPRPSTARPPLYYWPQVQPPGVGGPGVAPPATPRP